MNNLPYSTVVVGIILALIGMPLTVYAQDVLEGKEASVASTTPELITDRPDQTESSWAVPRGHFQLETGAVLEIQGNIRAWTFNTSLFRYGIAKNLELRMVTEFTQIGDNSGGQSPKMLGLSDLQLGLKYQFIQTSNFQMAYLGHFVIPNGSTFLTNEQVGVSNKICFEHSVSEKIGMGYNFGFDYLGNNNDALTFTYAIGFALTDKLGFFTEIYGSWIDFNTLDLNYDNGFTYLIKPNLQFDMSFGTGINNRYNFYSMGISWLM